MYSIFTDGGARGNPGPAATGVAIFKSEKSLGKDADSAQLGVPFTSLSTHLGETTNNVAEWSAVLEAVEWLDQSGENEADFYLDSQLVERQIIGKYKVKDTNLKVFKSKYDLLAKGKKLTFYHIPRALNSIADELVNQTLDSFES